MVKSDSNFKVVEAKYSIDDWHEMKSENIKALSRKIRDELHGDNYRIKGYESDEDQCILVIGRSGINE
jgi:hypothetical protein